MDGFPRDCAISKCGAEMDNTIIRQQELGTSKASVLDRTKVAGPVDAASAISTLGVPTARARPPPTLLPPRRPPTLTTSLVAFYPTLPAVQRVKAKVRARLLKDAKVTMNVPGTGVGGLSAATITDFSV